VTYSTEFSGENTVWKKNLKKSNNVDSVTENV